MAGVMLAYGAAGGGYVHPGSPLFRAFADLARAAYAEGLKRGKG